MRSLLLCRWPYCRGPRGFCHSRVKCRYQSLTSWRVLIHQRHGHGASWRRRQSWLRACSSTLLRRFLTRYRGWVFPPGKRTRTDVWRYRTLCERTIEACLFWGVGMIRYAVLKLPSSYPSSSRCHYGAKGLGVGASSCHEVPLLQCFKRRYVDLRLTILCLQGHIIPSLRRHHAVPFQSAPHRLNREGRGRFSR